MGKINWMAVLCMGEVALPLLRDTHLFAVQKCCHWDQRTDICV